MSDSAESVRTRISEEAQTGIRRDGEGAGEVLESADALETEPELRDELGHPHAQMGEVPQVRRRRSPIDPADGSWAIVGAGSKRSVVLDALAAVGIPAVGYEKNPSIIDKNAAAGKRSEPSVVSDRSERLDQPQDPSQSYEPVQLDRPEHPDAPGQFVRYDHVVVSVDEIDDIEGLAVTSRDRFTGEINTDYYAGIVVATKDTGFCGDLVDSFDTSVSQAPGVFTPHHPALVFVGPTRTGNVPTGAGSVSTGAGVGPTRVGNVRTGVRSGAAPVTQSIPEPANQAVAESAARSQTEAVARAQADFAAAYAKLLAGSPREALSFHRQVCTGTGSSLNVSSRPPTVGERELSGATPVVHKPYLSAAAGGISEHELRSTTLAVDKHEPTITMGADGEQELIALLHELLQEIAAPTHTRSTGGFG